VTPIIRERFFGYRHAFSSRLVLVLTIIVVAVLSIAPFVFQYLKRRGKLSEKLQHELWIRWISWVVLAPLMIGPVLLGTAPTIFAITILSLVCYREFARATGLFREHIVSFVVILGILLINFASLDVWYALFTALPSLVVATIAAVSILQDQPKGYIQRVGLGVIGFMLFGVCFGHLSFFANDTRFREILFWIVLCVELNNVFAFICGKSFGHRKLAPNTSPNKTIGGSLGALVLTTLLAASLEPLVFRGTALDSWRHAFTLGIMISVLGQLGDLLLSSVKRDLGIKDMAATIPGHGGFLDRFNSLLLVSPAVFHYVGYFLGIGLNQQHRIITAGLP
jgi:phosphatidate cytidylyltransferase